MNPTPGSRYTGFPNQSEAEADEPLDLTRRFMPRPTSTFLMRQRGHQLSGIGIRSGDYLVVDRSLDPTDGSVAVVEIDDERVSVIWRCDRGRVRLEVNCPGMPPGAYTWGEGCQVFGVVTGVLRDLLQTA